MRWPNFIRFDDSPPPPPFNSRSWLRPTWELQLVWFQFRPKQIRFKFQLELITSSSDYGKWLKWQWFDNSTNYSIRQWMKQWTRSNYSLESSNSIQCNNRTDEFNLNLSRVPQQSIREIDNQHISELDPHPYDNTSAKMNPSFHRASTRLGDGAHHQINRWKWPNREQ